MEFDTVFLNSEAKLRLVGCKVYLLQLISIIECWHVLVVIIHQLLLSFFLLQYLKFPLLTYPKDVNRPS